jgi:hypothetical protein
MFLAKFVVTGVTDLMFGSPVSEPKKDSETHDQYEERTWRHKCRLTNDGQLCLNPFAVTNSLVTAAQWLGRKVPGEGKKTFTDRFRKGVAPHGRVLLLNGKPLTIDDVDPQRLFVPSDGKHGGPRRVFRIFPTLHDWQASGTCLVFDGKITRDQFFEHLETVGKFIGWGSMRVEGGGINGRFTVDEVTVEEMS